MKCDHCEKNSDFLIPVKVVDFKEVRDLRLCTACFEIYKSPNQGDKNLQFSSISYPNFTEGNCKACGCETKYLREITLNLADDHRDILLCPSCYKKLRFLQEKGDLRDFPPYISGLK
jgi:protein-arginine kinase activator protein McsA